MAYRIYQHVLSKHDVSFSVCTDDGVGGCADVEVSPGIYEPPRGTYTFGLKPPPDLTDDAYQAQCEQQALYEHELHYAV